MVDKVLFVDDEKAVLESIRRFCHRKDFYPSFCTSASEALELVKREKFSVIVTDMRMPEMDGADFLKKTMEHDREPIKIVLTGYADIEAVQRSINEGNVYKYLSKPIDGKELLKIVQESIDFFNDKKSQKNRLLKLGEFVSKIIHDLRNPLLGIRGSAQVLLEYFDDINTAQEFCKLIIEQSDELVSMAAELLEYASQPEDKRYTQLKVISVNELTAKWASVWEQELQARSIDLEIINKGEFYLDIVPNQILRALNNMIRNSLDMKNVTHLRLLIDSDTSKDGYLSMKLMDNAGGVPDEIISKIFESFFTYGKPHGTGLGLANTKSIVEYLKGTISVMNKKWEHGLGAQFEISLPLCKEANKSIPAATG